MFYRQRSTGSYPFTDYDIRRTNPEISLPEVIDAPTADFLGFDIVVQVAQPMPNAGMVVVEGIPVQQSDQSWLQTWVQETAPVITPPPTPTPLPITQITPLEFLARFTAAEQLAIVTEGQTVPALMLWVLQAMGASYIDLTDPITIAGVNNLVTIGLITSDRVSAILAMLNGVAD